MPLTLHTCMIMAWDPSLPKRLCLCLITWCYYMRN